MVRLEADTEVLTAGDGTASTGTQETADSSTADPFDCVTSDGYVQSRLSSRGRAVLAIGSLLVLCGTLYSWNAKMAGRTTNMGGMIAKPLPLSNETNKYSHSTMGSQASILDNVTLETGIHQGIIDSSATISITKEEPDPAPLPDAGTSTSSGNAGQCPLFCEGRHEARKKKFGGDLYDLKDVLKMANKGRDNLISDLKKDYGEYFEQIFVKKPGPNATEDDPPSYESLIPMSEEGHSRHRLRRKLQLKVLKVIASLKTSEENVHGCNCRSKVGTPTAAQQAFMDDIPDYYQTYVFANGGHSQAAGHGNVYSQTYTAYIGQDLRTVWKALGVKMIDRNMGMGAMRTFPQISSCAKEIFGTDVDLLSWYYGMTDKDKATWTYYTYRAAVTPGRPANVSIEGGSAMKLGGLPLEEMGLSIWHSDARKGAGLIPDSTPEGIPLTADELNKLPPMLQNLVCNGRYEGKDQCSLNKWHCTVQLQRAGEKCTCPRVGKRSGWHMGYRMHSLQAHYISLPVVEILLEGINELVKMDKDPETLLKELQAEEDEEFNKFLSYSAAANFSSAMGSWLDALGDEFDNFFSGPSICRTSLLPAMSRYLGLTTDSDKVGGAARCGEETYDTSIPFSRRYGKYKFLTNRTIPAGEFAIVGPVDFRSCPDKNECPEIVMPDYKDWFMANLTTGSASITFPNKREREYYGYDRAKFKGMIGIVQHIFPENASRQRWDFDIAAGIRDGYLILTVNGERVTKVRSFGLLILEGPNGIYWKPSANDDYVFEFKVQGEANGKPVLENHLRMLGFVLY